MRQQWPVRRRDAIQLDAVSIFSELLRSPEPITALAPPPAQ